MRKRAGKGRDEKKGGKRAGRGVGVAEYVLFPLLIMGRGGVNGSSLIYEVIVRAQRYYERVERTDPLCRAIIRRLEHAYYKKDVLNNKIESDLAAKLNYTAEDVRSS